MCAHGGQATPLSTVQNVRLGGMPVAVQPIPHVIAGCSLPPPPAANGPCVTCQWATASTSVFANGMPVLLLDSQAVAAPTGAPVKPVGVQTLVSGM